MSQSMLRAASAVILLAGTPWIATAAAAPEPAPEPATQAVSVYSLVEQGRQALVADRYADSFKLLQQAMARPDFAHTEPGLRYFTFLLAAYAAQGIDDNLSAHEFFVAATSYPDADGEVWLRRSGAAAKIEKWADSGLALAAVAKKWPKSLKNDEYHAWVVGKTARELGKSPATRPQQIDLLNALFEAGYKMRFGSEPSFLWLDLATDALDRNDLKRAREITRRITDSSVLLSMRIDKRFDVLTAEDPKLFDVRAAAAREAKHLKSVVRENPKSLGAVVQYGYALYTLGQFDEMLTLADGVIARVEKPAAGEPPYEDLDEGLNWIHNHKATALRALGRWDEAAAALASWEHSERNAGDKVSQAINLGFFYNELGRPDEALKAVDSLDWSRGMSEYGRTQCQFVRFQAYLQLGQDSKVQEIVSWMRVHQADSMDTAQGVLLESGDADGAAALLVSRLRNADERTRALAEIQTYAATPRTARQKKLDAQKESLLARTEVAAAIAEYGRREKFPVYSLEY